MSDIKHVIKIKGHKEEFYDKKLKLSIFAACLNAHLSDEEADIIADKVSLKVKEWIYKQEGEIGTDQIFKMASEELRKLNEAAAFMYSTHRDIS
jgi:transcriptional regulator NrdR family protein